jgi:phosphopantothenoylcysteine decarboxylase/phosphopantothenate--cysteine ligase
LKKEEEKAMSFGTHTSKSIIGTKSKSLEGRKIILCVTGSVAAVRSPDIARELMRHGAEVYAVMTPMAQKILHPYLLEWSTGNPVVTELTGEIEHVTLAGDHPERADLILIAPSTANTIGKVAAGIDDTPVTTVLTTGIGAGIPVIIAPAMHQSMYNHPIVKENIKKLESIGVEVMMPRVEEEKAKIPETEEIVQRVIERLAEQRDLEGKKVLVTAGPTREYIDAFRYISNPSSGKMGVAVAEEAAGRGADVTLILGPSAEKASGNMKLQRVETTKEMLDAVTGEIGQKDYDIVILSAAVSDFGPTERPMEKIPSSTPEVTIYLRPLPKIVEQVKKIDPKVFLVGFKAEYNISEQELIDRSYKRLMEAGMDLIVANDVSKQGVGFAVDTNEVYVIDKNKEITHISLTSKASVAKKILDIVDSHLKA